MEASTLTPKQKYAAAALFALALHHSQVHQTRPSSYLIPLKEETVGESVPLADHSQLWIDESSGLLSPVFSFLGVENQKWHKLRETAELSSQMRHCVGVFFTLLSEASDGTSSERSDKELALTKAVDSMVHNMESSAVAYEDSCGSTEYEIKCQEKLSITKPESVSDGATSLGTKQGTGPKMSTEEKTPGGSGIGNSEESLEEEKLLPYQTKVAVLYELLLACVADDTGYHKKCHQGKGYDARHRVALRVLSTWLKVKWIKMEAIETIVSCSMMAIEQEKGKKEDGSRTSESPKAAWKRGGIIGAAALTGGTLMAVTGGLAAPAIAQGLGALAPTLGSIVPAVGASGFAATAAATGSAAGSVAVAASFGAAGAGLTGRKMARRIGSIDEFEFKSIGENHKQGRLAVGIMISGLVFEGEDFVKPWEGQKDNLERYVLCWESRNLIALSTAIQDWLTSKIAMGLMKEGAMQTVLSSLLTAFALPAALVSASDLIDSKWAVAVNRSDKAGKLMAEVLLEGLQGNRPVTLIGFSLGARVIFKCLQCLAETGDNAGLVERVVFLGAPISIEDEKWVDARKMVAGRFVNAYSTRDWTLGIAFRASLLSRGIAGIQPVDIPGIENVDVTELIEGHSSYIWMTRQILERLDLEDYNPVFRTTHAQS